MEWLLKYNSAMVMHLPPFKSNHRPILLKLMSNSVKKRNVLFKFLATWLTNKTFPKVVKKCWDMGKGWMEASSDFKA